MDTKTEIYGRNFLTLFFTGLIQEGLAHVSISFIYKESCPKSIIFVILMLFYFMWHGTTEASFHMVVGSLKTVTKKYSHYWGFQTVGYSIPLKMHINIIPNWNTIITINSTIWKGRICIIFILLEHSTIYLPTHGFQMQWFFFSLTFYFRHRQNIYTVIMFSKRSR